MFVLLIGCFMRLKLCFWFARPKCETCALQPWPLPVPHSDPFFLGTAHIMQSFLLLPQASMRFRHLRLANRASGNQMHLVGWVWEFHSITSPAHPTPPQQLRSIHRVCVASTMCASSKNVIIPTPPHPTPPQQLRSIHHVCKFKECHHPDPTPPQQLRSIHHVCKSKECHHGRTSGLARTCVTMFDRKSGVAW